MSNKISKELFSKIRHIQFVTNQLANDVLAGAYRSAFKGKGMEFEEVREYETGDEIRNIDWNVTARMNHPFVKVFREERDLTLMLVVDISASCKFGSLNVSKANFITEVGALLSFSAIKNNDKVGLILFSDIIEKYIPPRKGLRHVLLIIRELIAFQGKNKKSNLSQALDYLGKVETKRSICFLISDFIVSDYFHSALLISKKHDLVSILVEDPFEKKLPNMNLVRIKDLETEEVSLIDTSSKTVQNGLLESSEKIEYNTKKLMKKLGAGFIYLNTESSYIDPLRKFFRLRNMQRR